jgi:hypothetical protein
VGRKESSPGKLVHSIWSKAYWKAMHSHSARGAHINMMMVEGQERVQAAFRDNYARLAAIKKKYYPNNLFHLNQN